jgi:hypothetical protein
VYLTHLCSRFLAKSNLVLVAILLCSSGVALANPTRATNACSEQEVWKVTAKIPKPWFELFAKQISQKKSLLADYNKAFVMKTRMKDMEAKVFADYWMARTLYALNIKHLANRAFNQIVASPLQPGTMGIKVAALQCINRIQDEYPSLLLSKEALDRMGSLDWKNTSAAQQNVMREAAVNYLKSQPAEVSWKSDIVAGKAYRLVKDGDAYEAFIEALLSMREGNYQDAILKYQRFFAYGNKIPNSLKKHTDMLHLLLGRVHYERREFDQAIAEFKKVRVESNYFPQSLSDVSWAYLLKKKFNEAVGSAFSLQTGLMAKTFNPEAPVVGAIALVELCHYPDALRQLKHLQKSYLSTYKWLYSWASGGQNQHLYDLLLDVLSKKKTGIPSKVSAEWIRSSVYLAAQKELNLVDYEKNISNRILALIRTQPKPGFARLKDMLDGLIPELMAKEKSLVDRINFELTAVSRRLLEEISSAAENAQLVEADVYNAAGDDMIQKNARPDIVAAARRLKDDPNAREKLPTYDWGSLPSSVDENTEVWEDELGFMSGDLTDDCPKGDVPPLPGPSGRPKQEKQPDKKPEEEKSLDKSDEDLPEISGGK